jgi:hypothetical protein
MMRKVFDVPNRQVVNNRYFVVIVDEPVHQMRANESSPASDENAHESLPLPHIETAES